MTMKRLAQVKSLERLIEEIRDTTGKLHSELRGFSFNAQLESGPEYIPEHFRPQELVPPEIYSTYGDTNSYWFIDSRVLWTLDAMREYFGAPITVNNWLWGGNLTMRGFRPFDSQTGSPLSQHRFGRAVDFDVKGFSADKVRRTIRESPSETAFSYITAIEEDVSWCHVDCRTTCQEGIIWFHP